MASFRSKSLLLALTCCFALFSCAVGWKSFGIPQFVEEYGECKIAKVTLLWKRVGANPLMSQDVIYNMEEFLKKKGEFADKEHIKHCAIVLSFDKDQSSCQSVVIEHNEVIYVTLKQDWLFAMDSAFMAPNPIPKMGVTKVWKFADDELKKDGDKKQDVFHVIKKMFEDDPDVEQYDVQSKNCCDFARTVLKLTLKDAEAKITELETEKKLQNSAIMNEALENAMGRLTATLKKNIVWTASSTTKVVGGAPDWGKVKEHLDDVSLAETMLQPEDKFREIDPPVCCVKSVNWKTDRCMIEEHGATACTNSEFQMITNLKMAETCCASLHNQARKGNKNKLGGKGNQVYGTVEKACDVWGCHRSIEEDTAAKSKLKRSQTLPNKVRFRSAKKETTSFKHGEKQH